MALRVDHPPVWVVAERLAPPGEVREAPHKVRVRLLHRRAIDGAGRHVAPLGLGRVALALGVARLNRLGIGVGLGLG